MISEHEFVFMTHETNDKDDNPMKNCENNEQLHITWIPYITLLKRKKRKHSQGNE